MKKYKIMKKKYKITNQKLFVFLEGAGLWQAFEKNVYSSCRSEQEIEQSVRRINDSATISGGIFVAFSWAESPEGFEYWDRVYNEIRFNEI